MKITIAGSSRAGHSGWHCIGSAQKRSSVPRYGSLLGDPAKPREESGVKYRTAFDESGMGVAHEDPDGPE